MIRAIAIAAYLLAPDCQRLCLGTCWFSWTKLHCEDTMVVRLGEWDPIPSDYVPATEDSFPAWPIPYPRPWGDYSLEHSE